jgi:hypothetical protein
MSQSDAFKRIDQLLTIDAKAGDVYARIVEMHTGAVTLATAIYSAGRPQIQLLLDTAKKANSDQRGDAGWKYREWVLPAVKVHCVQ